MGCIESKAYAESSEKILDDKLGTDISQYIDIDENYVAYEHNVASSQNNGSPPKTRSSMYGRI
jgi:hypothetical protein